MISILRRERRTPRSFRAFPRKLTQNTHEQVGRAEHAVSDLGGWVEVLVVLHVGRVDEVAEEDEEEEYADEDHGAEVVLGRAPDRRELGAVGEGRVVVEDLECL